MPAKVSVVSFPANVIRGKKPLYMLALVGVLALAFSAHRAWAVSSSTQTSTQSTSAITPALKLAIGTVGLEGTDQAVDAASAAKLLPLWQLLDQLETSDSAAPQEISAVIAEIQRNMTASQLKAIDAMPISRAELAGSSRTASSASGTQVSAAGADPMLAGGPPSGGVPMDGGGPMGSGNAQSASTSKASASAAGSVAIEQVIKLLQSKVQG